MKIEEHPYGMAVSTPFPADEEHASYERAYVERFWDTLGWFHGVLDGFSGWFCGKQSPLAFLQSAYEAGVETAGWDADDLASSACPPQSELQRLRLR